MLLLFVALGMLSGSHAADSQVPETDLKALESLVHALHTDDRGAVASLMSYPVRRERPLSDIGNAGDFVRHYAEYFDPSTIKRIVAEAAAPWHSWRGTGTSSGAVWLDEGKVTKLNVKTNKYEEALAAARKKDNAGLHRSARGYSELIADCLTPKHHIRIHKHGDAVKYFSWNQGRSLIAKPDLVLAEGKVELEGTARNLVATFRNGAYIYEFSAPNVCGEICDPHLIVRKGEEELATEVCAKN